MDSVTQNNVRTMINIDVRNGKLWASAYTADLVAVLDELERLQAVEASLKDAIAWKKEQAEQLRVRAQEHTYFGHLDWAMDDDREARGLDEEVFALKRIAEGKLTG